MYILIILTFLFHPTPTIHTTPVKDVCVSTACGEHRQGANLRNLHDPRFQGADKVYRMFDEVDL